MEVTFELNGGNEVRLMPILEDENASDGRVYSMVAGDSRKRYLRVKLANNSLEIIEKSAEIVDAPEVLESKMSELLIELIESIQGGTEETESASSADNPYDPELIRVEPKQFSLRQIFDMINDGDVELSPDFQRHFVWDGRRKSRLIESILLRIPLPMFYFSQDDEGRITVVDGLQRLTTIRDFMQNKFKLRDLEYLGNCVGKYYQRPGAPSIDAKYFRYFNMTQITVNVIDPSSPSKVKYDIFRRINTGGKPLNAQEIRNCLASEKLRVTLRDMVALPSFVQATGGSVKDVRMEAQELALRFIYFHTLYSKDNTLEDYNGNIETELDSLVDSLSKDKDSDLTTFVSLFDKAMLNAHFLFGDYSFRKIKLDSLQAGARKQLINKALFVSWSVLLSGLDPRFVAETASSLGLVQPLAQRITEDYQLYEYLTSSTNSKVNIQKAFSEAEKLTTAYLLSKK